MAWKGWRLRLQRVSLGFLYKSCTGDCRRDTKHGKMWSRRLGNEHANACNTHGKSVGFGDCTIQHIIMPYVHHSNLIEWRTSSYIVAVLHSREEDAYSRSTYHPGSLISTVAWSVSTLQTECGVQSHFYFLASISHIQFSWNLNLYSMETPRSIW